MIKPILSIITVCLNSDKTILDCINSVNNLIDKSLYEHIIVDGGSIDKTNEIVRNNIYPNIRHYIFNNSGIYDAMNFGLAMSRGEFILFLNSDDFIVNFNLIDFIRKYHDMDLISFSVELKNYKNKTVRYAKSTTISPIKISFGFHPPHPGLLISKRLFNRVGFFSLGYSYSSDYDLFVRISLIQNIKQVAINTILTTQRTGGISTRFLWSSFYMNYYSLKSIKNHKLLNIGPFFYIIKPFFKIYFTILHYFKLV